MTRRLRRGGAALLMLALAPGLSACGDFDPATNLVRPDNAAGETPTEDVVARAIVLVKSPNAAASALAGTLINRGDKPDTLDTIEIVPDGGAAPISLKPALTLNPGQAIAMGTEAHQPLTVQDNGTLKVGHFATVTMRFRTSGDVKMEVPVEVRDRYYSSVVPATSGTTATQADRRLANCAVTGTKPTAKANAACASPTQAARQAARAAAGRANGTTGTTDPATTGTTGTTGTTTSGTTGTTGTTGTAGTPATGKAGSGALPTAKKQVAKAPQQAGTHATTQTPGAPGAQEPAGHAPAGPAPAGH